MGFVPHATSRKTRLQDGEFPTQTLESNGKKKRRAKTWAYLIITAITSTFSVVYTFVVYPIMVKRGWSAAGIAGMTLLFFFLTYIVMYVWVAPAIIKAIVKSSRFMTKKETETLIDIIRVVFFFLLLFVFTAIMNCLSSKSQKSSN